MITLIASILGFLSAIVPEFIKTYSDKQTKNHELDLLKIQKDIQFKQLYTDRKNLLDNLGSQERHDMYQTYYSGIKWTDALNATVRPVIAYAFFFLYATIKLITFVELKNSPLMIIELWNENDMIIFTTIISFYFGSRTLLNKKR